MSDQHRESETIKLEFEFDIDAEPETVWQVVVSPEHRKKWLPSDLMSTEAIVSATPGEEVRYRMRDGEPPFLESVVTFQVIRKEAGGTCLRIIHELSDQRLSCGSKPANSNAAALMLAA